MTNTQIQKAIETAKACLEREEPLDKELELAEWSGRATSRIKKDVERNNKRLCVALEKLAREEMRGTVIDYDCNALPTLVHEEREDIEWREGK